MPIYYKIQPSILENNGIHFKNKNELDYFIRCLKVNNSHKLILYNLTKYRKKLLKKYKENGVRKRLVRQPYWTAKIYQFDPKQVLECKQHNRHFEILLKVKV